MDVYVVRDGERIVGVTAKLQGAELLRADHALDTARLIREKSDGLLNLDDQYADVYERTSIENHELQDAE